MGVWCALASPLASKEVMRLDYSDDIDTAARLGWGPDELNRHASVGFDSGQLAEFFALDKEARSIVLDCLAGADDAHDHLEERPDKRELAEWMLNLPAFRKAAVELDGEA